MSNPSTTTDSTNDDAWRGKVGKLADDEVSAFLAEDHLARVASLNEQGWPYVVPMWHEWTGNSFFVIGRSKSQWAHYLARDPRCAITIDEADGQRKFVARCTALIVETPNVGGAWVPIAERMSVRYLGPNGSKYLEPTLGQPRWLIELHPVEVKTWQGNDWADRYR